MLYEVHLDEATAAAVEASGFSLAELVQRGLSAPEPAEVLEATEHDELPIVPASPVTERDAAKSGTGIAGRH